ncbi:MAG TPA: hypothetical protein VLJ76_10635 [Gaiellaceae bacterium]|nr:hypothetical protein [Gaiellaceae bacterium]
MIPRRQRWVAAVIATAGTVGLIVALLLRPGDGSVAFEAYVLFLGAVGTAMLAQATSRRFSAPTESELAAALRRRAEQDPRVPDLVRLEREVEMAAGNAYDTHYRLRPTLREIASGLLARSSAVDLDTSPDAEKLLGPDAWSLVRPGVERPRNHHAPGAPLSVVERAVAALEDLGP